MDYRKPVVFGENWSPSRYKVLPYFAAEKRFLSRRVDRLLDLGCANGWNMSRFQQYGQPAIGLDPVPERVALALAHGPAFIGDGMSVPAAAGSFDVVYVQHVLHHIGSVEQALIEIRRVLKPGGLLFLIETTEDNPLVRWGRRVYPSWMGDEVNAHFLFTELCEAVNLAGFRVVEARQFSVLFWLWETAPDQLPFLERLTPLAARFEQLLLRRWRTASAHCYLAAFRE